MWNISRSNGLYGPVMVPHKTHKRDFSSFNLSNVAILPEKAFKNPNFVNNQYPNIHCAYSSTPQINLSSTPASIKVISNKSCQNSDISGTGTDTEEICSENYRNSSQNTTDNIKENQVEKIPVETNPMCYSRKRCKKVRRSRKKKSPSKNSKQNNCRRQINDMMEIDIESDISMNGCDSSIGTLSPKSLHLTDFIGEISDITNKPSKADDEVFAVISISPPNNCKTCPRERELSICESEDSFIVFDSGTDEELKFSDSDDNTELDSEEDDSDSEIDDDFDSSHSIVPSKKVRFAGKEDLCEIHPMVQWSFAYRNARKGPWEEYARDRERFNKRINQTERILGPVFNDQHRENVYRQRFQVENV